MTDVSTGDEVLPVCGPCASKGRHCRPRCENHLQIRQYRPRQARRATLTGDDGTQHARAHVSTLQTAAEVNEETFVMNALSPEVIGSFPSSGTSRSIEDTATSPLSSRGTQALCTPALTTDGVISRHEARLIHHYATRLGRWLDCTDATRQFTLHIPRLIHHPILRHAVVSFAARHLGDTKTAEEAHGRCVELLIPQLNSENVDQDEAILCAIVILRVFEQLNGTTFETFQLPEADKV